MEIKLSDTQLFLCNKVTNNIFIIKKIIEIWYNIIGGNMKKIISGIIFVLLIGAFIFLGTRDYKKETISDQELFSNEYQEIDENNVFTYVNASKVYSTLRNGTAIIFMGFNSNVWAGYYANIINDVAMDNGIEEVYYYNFLEDRNNKNATYESIVELLNKYVTVLDDGAKNIYSPTLVIVKEGKIIYFNDRTALTLGFENPKDYWTEDQIELERQELDFMIKQYLSDNEVEEYE